MMTEDGDDIQEEERAGLKRKPTGPPRLLLGRTRTRSSVENHDETSARCSAAAEELTCRGRPNAAGDSDDSRNRKRSRWWSRFSSRVLCIRKNPTEGVLQRSEKVSLNDREENNKKKKFKMGKVLRRFITSADVQQAQNQSRGDKSPKSFQKKLQKFFIRGGKKQSDLLENMEDMKVEEDQSKRNKPLNKDTDESLEAGRVTAEKNAQLMEDRAAAEGPEPPTGTSEEVLRNMEPETIQTVDINQVPVEVVSSEDDEVLCDSVVFVDLHHLLQSEEQTTQTSQSPEPSTNRPSIRIEVCPPENFIQEEEEECWDSISYSENHLHLLFGFDHSERQLLQMACSLVRTAMSAAVDQLSREQQNDEGQRMTSELQIQRRVELEGALPAPSSLNI